MNRDDDRADWVVSQVWFVIYNCLGRIGVDSEKNSRTIKSLLYREFAQGKHSFYEAINYYIKRMKS